MKKCIVNFVMLISALLFTGCNGGSPAYLHPYGDGSDARPVTAEGIVTHPTTVTTAQTSQEESSDDEVIHCEECGGEKIVCSECQGIGKVNAEEIIDEETGKFYKIGDPCPMCEDGYICSNCDSGIKSSDVS